MNLPYAVKATDERLAKISGLAVIAAVLLAMCSAFVA
jgi:hypothetical protein